MSKICVRCGALTLSDKDLCRDCIRDYESLMNDVRESIDGLLIDCGSEPITVHLLREVKELVQSYMEDVAPHWDWCVRVYSDPKNGQMFRVDLSAVQKVATCSFVLTMDDLC